MYGGMTPERTQSQASLPPLESPYLINGSSRSISFMKSPTQTERAQLYKLQEQLKTFQDEIMRKDKLIDQLSKIELKNCPENFLEPKLLPNRNICVEREEVAALNVKLDNMRNELSEAMCELKQKETIVESMKRINCELREEIARLQVALGNCNKDVNEFGEAKEAFETMRQRNNILISSLQDELTETQQGLVENKVYAKELEDQISDISAARDELQRQIQDIKLSITEATSEEIYNVSEVINKVKTLIFENDSSKNKILSLEEKLKSRDCEQQASRQTITRLVAKLSAEETKNANNDEKIANLTREVDQYKVSKTIIETDINSYECQLTSLRKEIELLTQDNEIKSKRIQEISATAKTNQQTDEQQALINHFINSLISILSENYKTPKNDSLTIFEWIIGCVKSLLQNKGDVKNTPSSPLNETINSLRSDIIDIEKLNSRISSEEDPQLRLTVEDLNKRLKNAETDLLSSSLIIDGLNCDKTKYFRILSELARVMNMNEINKDIGFDMISEALYARATQLQKLEYDVKTDHRLTEHSLNRKVKELKEKVHSKDLHIDLLHKKLASTEGRQQSVELIGKERDKELLSNKKLAKHNQKLQEEVENLRAEVIELKGSLINYNKLKVNALSLDQEVKSLTAKVNKLESIRQKQSKLLSESKSSQINKEQELNEIKETADAAIASLNTELRVVKDSLNDCKRKENQMIEMRTVIAKLLGLDLDNLAIPDFEIINRLERLITAHHSNIYTQYSMEKTLQEMNQGFFHDPCVVHTHHTHLIDEKPIYPKTKNSQ